ncbi:MAG: hypothetical protein N3F09_03985 [Bacteroidia bacterium]|nr:hypothetical protein [Bacteroidia bacterium]
MNKALKKILFIVFLTISTGILHSQNQKIEQARTKFISEKLELSEKEAQKFWPVYNEYLDKQKQIRQERKKLFNSYAYDASDNEAQEFINKKTQLDISEKQLISEYTEKFKKILGAGKTARLLKAEEDFRLELVKILKDKQEN